MRTLDSLLKETASAMPSNLCLIQRDGTTVTYGKLSAMAAAIHAHLRAEGIGPGDRVGLCANKSIAAVSAIFAIMRCGAAYVPVDPRAPSARSAGIFSNCKVRAVLADANQSAALIAESRDRHPLTPAGTIGGLHCLRASASDCERSEPALAYILYTSGSTGVPKGVVHTHASALAFVDWCSKIFSPTAADRFSSHAPLHFDLSVLDLYLAVKHGAAVRIIDTDEGRQPGALVDLAEKDRLTIWYSTPTVLRSMVEYGGLAERDLSALRVVCYAGEVFPTKQLKALGRALPHPTYYNLFGPTETNVCTCFRLGTPSEMDDDEVVPIGFAASGDRLMIVEPDGSPVAEGEMGELLVSGGSVMTGYWNLPERNASAFVEICGARWYRTGDLVRKREDGALVYHGRGDRMVKRRGYRIELGEIEAAMLRNPAIQQGAAVQVTDPSGDVHIVHFYCADASAGLTLLALKRFAATQLPNYMIPDRFHSLDVLPMTSTDKIDYQSLKESARGFFAHG
jgi:amino acid adenylation domain-containing protein